VSGRFRRRASFYL
jgi:hypothetical protein